MTPEYLTEEQYINASEAARRALYSINAFVSNHTLRVIFRAAAPHLQWLQQPKITKASIGFAVQAVLEEFYFATKITKNELAMILKTAAPHLQMTMAEPSEREAQFICDGLVGNSNGYVGHVAVLQVLRDFVKMRNKDLEPPDPRVAKVRNALIREAFATYPQAEKFAEKIVEALDAK
jgi:hypothetical protein